MIRFRNGVKALKKTQLSLKLEFSVALQDLRQTPFPGIF